MDAERDTLITMSELMKQAFGLIRRPWGVFYLKNKTTGQQTSLKTSDKVEAQRVLQAHNETESQPHFNLSLARVYLNGADPKLATRTWQEVMEHLVAKKKDETRLRWDTAVKDKNFDSIRHLRVAETRPEHFDRALADGKVSTNVYLRRIHNHALGMDAAAYTNVFSVAVFCWAENGSFTFTNTGTLTATGHCSATPASCAVNTFYGGSDNGPVTLCNSGTVIGTTDPGGGGWAYGTENDSGNSISIVHWTRQRPVGEVR
jgi:hypothetical protein